MKYLSMAAAGCFLCLWASGFAFGSSSAMKAPHTKAHLEGNLRETQISCADLALLGAIRFYRAWISPIGGKNRCGFRPSCSAFGYEAISDKGPLLGTLMTSDRLMRCNIWKKPGPDYMLLPNGKLYDPPSKNTLKDP